MSNFGPWRPPLLKFPCGPGYPSGYQYSDWQNQSPVWQNQTPDWQNQAPDWQNQVRDWRNWPSDCYSNNRSPDWQYFYPNSQNNTRFSHYTDQQPGRRYADFSQPTNSSYSGSCLYSSRPNRKDRPAPTRFSDIQTPLPPPLLVNLTRFPLHNISKAEIVPQNLSLQTKATVQPPATTKISYQIQRASRTDTKLQSSAKTGETLQQTSKTTPSILQNAPVRQTGESSSSLQYNLETANLVEPFGQSSLSLDSAAVHTGTSSIQSAARNISSFQQTGGLQQTIRTGRPLLKKTTQVRRLVSPPGFGLAKANSHLNRSQIFKPSFHFGETISSPLNTLSALPEASRKISCKIMNTCRFFIDTILLPPETNFHKIKSSHHDVKNKRWHFSNSVHGDVCAVLSRLIPPLRLDPIPEPWVIPGKTTPLPSVPVVSTRTQTPARKPNIPFVMPMSTASITSTPTTAVNQVTTKGKLTSDEARRKCQKLLSMVLTFSSKENQTKDGKVKILIQKLIDGKISTSQFSSQLRIKTNSLQQPLLEAILKEGLQPLRRSLALKEVTIDGITAPCISSLVDSPADATILQNEVTQSDTGKTECKTFLVSLLQLSSNQGRHSSGRNVKTLIQDLVDGKINEEEFSDRIKRDMITQAQPSIVTFLKKNLPLLRHSLATKELTIEGIRAPKMASEKSNVPDKPISTSFCNTQDQQFNQAEPEPIIDLTISSPPHQPSEPAQNVHTHLSKSAVEVILGSRSRSEEKNTSKVVLRKNKNCRIPGFKIIEQLVRPTVLPRKYGGTFAQKINVPLSSNSRSSEKSSQIVILCLGLTKDIFPVEETTKTISIESILFNGLFLPNLKGKPHFIIDVTRFWNRTTSCEVDILAKVDNWINNDEIFVCISIVRRLKTQEMLTHLKAQQMYIPLERTQKMVADTFKDDIENEIGLSDSLPISLLLCPLGQKKIDTPCRGIFCKHHSCFDAWNFLQTCENSTKWSCPHCRCDLPYEDLRIDKYFLNILSFIGDNVNNYQIKIDPDGSFSVSSSSHDETQPIMIALIEDEDVVKISSSDDEDIDDSKFDYEDLIGPPSNDVVVEAISSSNDEDIDNSKFYYEDLIGPPSNDVVVLEDLSLNEDVNLHSNSYSLEAVSIYEERLDHSYSDDERLYIVSTPPSDGVLVNSSSNEEVRVRAAETEERNIEQQKILKLVQKKELRVSIGRLSLDGLTLSGPEACRDTILKEAVRKRKRNSNVINNCSDSDSTSKSESESNSTSESESESDSASESDSESDSDSDCKRNAKRRKLNIRQTKMKRENEKKEKRRNKKRENQRINSDSDSDRNEQPRNKKKKREHKRMNSDSDSDRNEQPRNKKKKLEHKKISSDSDSDKSEQPRNKKKRSENKKINNYCASNRNEHRRNRNRKETKSKESRKYVFSA